MRKSPTVAMKGSYRRNKVLLRNLNNTSICEDRDRQTESGRKGETLEHTVGCGWQGSVAKAYIMQGFVGH